MDRNATSVGTRRTFFRRNAVLTAISTVLAICAVSACAATWNYDTVTEPMPQASWMHNAIINGESPWTDNTKTKLTTTTQMLVDAGFSLMNMYPDSFCRLSAPRDGDTWPEECKAEVKAMHAKGLRVLAGVYPTVGCRGPRELLAAHPEWCLVNPDAQKTEPPGLGCLLSPFGDALIDLLVSRIKEYDIDGYQFDGWYQFCYCTCPSCKTKFKADTGLDVPKKADQKNPTYLKYLVWRDEKLLDMFIKLRTAVKKIKPDAVLVSWNNNDCAGNYPSSMPEALNCLNDWTNKEWWDTFDVSSIWLHKRLRGSAGDRPAGIQPYMFMRHMKDIESGVYHGSSCPIEEVRYRMHKVMAMGSTPIIWSGARTGWNESDTKLIAQDYVDFMPYIHNTSSLKYAACIDSYTTLQMSRANGRDGLVDKMESHRAGIARALLEEHIPFDVISEHNVTLKKLAEYRVIILPNNFCMSDRIANVLREYVKNGGGLIATYETSLQDEWGTKRSDFALADLFGASYVSSAPAAACRVDYTAAKHPVTDDPAILNLTGTRGYTTYFGKFARVKAAQGTIAPLVGLDVANEKDEALKNWIPMLLSERGKGRVAYFPAAIDAAYFDAGYPYQRMIISNTVRWAAGDAPSIKVTAPKCVLAGFFTQEDPKTKNTKIIVHLLNDINSTTGHGSKEEKQFALREEVVPISGVKVAFAGKKPVKAYLVPGNVELQPTDTQAGWEVEVPKLDLHCVVVCEYGKERN